MSEEEAIHLMKEQSTADYDPSQFVRLRGQGQTGKLPSTYRCNKCNQAGHWIRDCPIMKVRTQLTQFQFKSTLLDS